ncbi:hypothetical protein AX16_002705 [Volvariella volvacea WC 439]|nr:hypothetical protein AX16_002705 [Volvariella volvacea WC 439]
MSGGGVIPHPLYEVRAYRFRKSFNKWKHHSTRLSLSDSTSSPAPSASRALNDPADDDEENSSTTNSDDTLVSSSISSGTVNSAAPRFRNRKYHPSRLRIITWNLDFTSPNPKERLIAALRHLEEEVLQCKEGIVTPDQACVIMFQEVHASVMPVFWEDEWVKENFYMAPLNSGRWPKNSIYGLVTLVERSLDIRYTGMLEFQLTNMARGGLLVDLALSTPGRGSRGGKNVDYDPHEDERGEVVVRIVNTHLESLKDHLGLRKRQLGLLASLLKMDEEVEGGIIAGDMNAIEPFDRGLPTQVGLRDAWRRGDDDESGFTWGKQGQNPGGKYPAARLDKILYLQRTGFRVDEPQRIGVGLKTVVGADGEEDWVSDHYGLVTTLTLENEFE